MGGGVRGEGWCGMRKVCWKTKKNMEARGQARFDLDCSWAGKAKDMFENENISNKIDKKPDNFKTE